MTDNIIFSNDSLSPENLTSNSSLTLGVICPLTEPGAISFTTYNAINILLLPLYIFILYLGLQQWKQKCSSSLTISHSDCFTYNIVVMELMGVVGCIFNCCAIYGMDFYAMLMDVLLNNFNWCGQTWFHILTCVERYLAVVHPITYLSLRNEKGIRIRNISIGCVWLLCFVGTGLCFTTEGFIIVSFCFLIFALTIVSFCSISVLCVLIGPGPGEQVEGRERIDQSKQRAFYTIMAILGVLGLRFSFGLIRMIFFVSNENSYCELEFCEIWTNLPSSLVLPFLFLQRTGKLKCFQRNKPPDQ